MQGGRNNFNLPGWHAIPINIKCWIWVHFKVSEAAIICWKIVRDFSWHQDQQVFSVIWLLGNLILSRAFATFIERVRAQLGSICVSRHIEFDIRRQQFSHKKAQVSRVLEWCYMRSYGFASSGEHDLVYDSWLQIFEDFFFFLEKKDLLFPKVNIRILFLSVLVPSRCLKQTKFLRNICELNETTSIRE
jgi:hypothetical protein